ncbi:MAG: GNAT family N-acetyltransferase [Candidatus Izimaplasma sp.]|nr:GNAT family N-acetyltransferase [Candidatus Izimaplasma bacterium]
MLTRARYNDLNELDKLVVLVINDMESSNIPQWSIGYPSSAHFKKDIEDSAIYIYKEENVILGSITVLPENDPPYKTINSWIKEKSIVIHRMLVHPNARNKGIAYKLLEKAIEIGKKDKYESIKIDTHLENYKMRNFLKKNGFVELEYLETIDRLAYELVLEE